MPRVPLILALVFLSISPSTVTAQQNNTLAQKDIPQQLKLEDAVRAAFQRSPRIQMQRAEVQEARGRLLGAQVLLHNPTVGLEAAQRSAPDQTGTAETGIDFTLGVSQELEIGGQRGQRTDAAKADIKAAEAHFLHDQRLLTAEVNLAFFEAVRARDFLEIGRQDMELARTLQNAAQRRLDAGSSTQLDVNLATAELGRAEERFFLAEGAYGETRALLAEVTGGDPGSPPLPVGDLAETASAALPPLTDLLASASSHRGDLEALQQTEKALQSRLSLARRGAIPNLTLGAFYGKEGSTDTLVGGGVNFALPVFNRNQGEIAEANAAHQRASAERALLNLQVQREVAAAYARYQAASRSVSRLQETVLGTLEENFQLLRRAYEAGKTSSTEVVVIRRSFIEAQRELVDAALMARRDRIILDLAAGTLTLPQTDQQDGNP